MSGSRRKKGIRALREKKTHAKGVPTGKKGSGEKSSQREVRVKGDGKERRIAKKPGRWNRTFSPQG